MPDIITPLGGEDAREAARRALEGPEHTAKREQEEKEKVLAAERSVLETKLSEIVAQKEKLELAWIELDNQRKAVRTVLNPLVTQEKKLEEEEATLEQTEAAAADPAERHATEEKRWAIQAERKALEEKKWTEEQKILAIEQTIEANTKQYRALLEEEDRARVKLDQLKLAQIPNAANPIKPSGE